MLYVKDVHDQLTSGNARLRYHGNGFIQMKLDDERRLHVWHPMFPVRKDHTGTIHSHRFDLSSTVLMGSLVHTTYKSRMTRRVPLDLHGTYEEYHSHKLWEMGNDASGDFQWELLKNCIVEVDEKYTLMRNSSYTFKADKLHTSEPLYPLEIVMTLMTKEKSYPQIHPVIVSPYENGGGEQMKSSEVTQAYDGVGAPSYADMVNCLLYVTGKYHESRG